MAGPINDKVNEKKKMGVIHKMDMDYFYGIDEKENITYFYEAEGV